MALGRPRSFDLDEALDQAMHVFWEHGYEGTTIPDLTAALGINRPSLYAAFGNKQSLFRKAIDRYLEGSAGHVRDALQAPTARAAVERLLRGSLDMLTDSAHPRGCFLVQTALACGDSADPIRREIVKHRAALQTALRKRFQQAISEGDLPKESDPGDLARYVAIILHGMALQAAGGAKRGELERVMAIALRAWPG